MIGGMPAATLEDSIDNGTLLRFNCDSCQYSAVYDPRELARMYGAGVEIAELARRAVCSRCGAKEGVFHTDNPRGPFSDGYGKPWG